MKKLCTVVFAFATFAATAGETIMFAEEDIACKDKAVTVEALKEPLPWMRLTTGEYSVAYANPRAYIGQLFSSAGWGRLNEEEDKCRYLGSVLGAKADTRHLGKFLVPMPARVDQRDGDLVCVQRPDAPPIAECVWLSSRPPTQRAGPKPQ